MSSAPVNFNIVVFGDSIQWGQGLRPSTPGASASDKMAELIGATLAANPTVASAWGAPMVVTVNRFAHSGATINAKLSSLSNKVTTPVTGTTLFPAGETPAGTPTILDQVAGVVAAQGTATPPVQANAVNLVILDGGINDVGLFSNILNPLVSPATVAARTNAACGGALTVTGAAGLVGGTATTGQMSGLLTNVATAFPNAIIVVTGYYDIISLSSDLMGLIMAVGMLTGSVVPGFLDPEGWLAMVLSGSIAASSAQAAVVANCTAFQTTSVTSLSSAVTLAAAAPGGSFTVPGSTPVSRVLFIPAPFSAANALFTGGSNGADETTSTSPALLWGFNPSLDVIGGIIDANVNLGSTLGGVFGFLTGGILGSAAGSAVGGLAGAATAIGIILPMLAAVDEVASSRLGPSGACAGIPPGPLGTGLISCHLASVGHPNIEGEAAYVGAITPPLITMFGTTLPGLGLLGVAGAISSASSGNCMIVTAALGSVQEEKVLQLRKLRDNVLLRSRIGRDFFCEASKEYYAFSPIIAARMNCCPEFKERVRSLAVSPFVGFVDLLSSWASGVSDDEFQQVLASTLDASLMDLANSGIVSDQVLTAAAEVSRMSVCRAGGAARSSIGAEIWGNEPVDVVNYFNVVAERYLPNDGAHIDVALLQPIKLYWCLLSERVASTPLRRIQTEFEARVANWLNVVASFSQFSGDDLGVELELLSDIFSTNHSSQVGRSAQPRLCKTSGSH